MLWLDPVLHDLLEDVQLSPQQRQDLREHADYTGSLQKFMGLRSSPTTTMPPLLVTGWSSTTRYATAASTATTGQLSTRCGRDCAKKPDEGLRLTVLGIGRVVYRALEPPRGGGPS